MPPPPRVAIAAYAYYPRYRGHLLELITRLTRGVADVHVVWVHAAGQGAAAPAGFGGRWTEHAHDGRGWEWGAYQAGLDTLRAQGWDGPVVFLNDTAGVHYPLPPAALAGLQKAAVANSEAALLAGHVQTAPAGFALHGQPIPAWVFSNAFVLSPAACALLEQRLFNADDFDAPQVRSDGTLHWPASVSPALAAHLDAWLLSSGKHGWRHHAGRSHVPPEQLRNKAGAILLEKRLSAQVLAGGGRLLHCGAPTGGVLQRLQRRAFFWRRRFAPMKAAAS
jgi:hypothetical protein